MSDHETQTSMMPNDDYDDGVYDDPLPLPQPRPRRRLVTPVTGALAALALAGGSFAGGVLVQKGQPTATANAAGAGGGGAGAFRAGAGAGAGGSAGGAGAGTAAGGRPGAGAGAGVTFGTVANTRGSVLYVIGSDGATLRVKTTDASKVTRNATAAAASVHPGDTVIVQGATAADGTITATSVSATGKGVSPGGGFAGGLAGRAGGGGPGPGPAGG